MIIPSLNHYVYGYKYTPAVANQFSTDLELVEANLTDEMFLVAPDNSLNYAFYEVYQDRHHSVNLLSTTEAQHLNAYTDVATLGRLEDLALPEGYHLKSIITSPKSDNSDRIYIYTYRK